MKPTSKQPLKHKAPRKRFVPTKNNYISYNKLPFERRAIFFGAGLGSYLRYAEDILFKSKKPVSSYTASSAEPLYNRKDRAQINTYIEYALQLIAAYNVRFGTTAAAQHKFFNRTAEQESFFACLFAGLQLQKRKVLGKNIPDTEIFFPFVGDGYQRLEAYREGQSCFEIEGNPVLERQIFAAGIFYVVNFVFDAIEKNDAALVSRLTADLMSFGLGTSYQAGHGKKGGAKSKSKEIENRERAYQLFLDKRIYDSGPKHTAMASAMMSVLKEAGIKTALSTVEKKWIPDFIVGYKKSC
jgi:hypothetical protein